MREEFKADGYRDFNQRYAGTYGWYEKDSGDKLLVQLQEVTDGRTCKFLDAEGSSFIAVADKGNFFEFIPLHRGVYNTYLGVVSCQRVPAKQYKRGISGSNSQITQLATSHRLSISFQLLEDMFGKQLDAEYLRLFRNAPHTVNAAIDKFLGFVHDKVYAFEFIIGKRVDNTIVLNTSLFLQEVKDSMVRNEISIEVVVQ